MGKNTIRTNKKAAQDLITEKEKLILAINSLIDGLIILNGQGVITMVNSQAEKYFNITKKEVLNKKINGTVLENCLYGLFKQIKKSASKRVITKEIPVFYEHKKESSFSTPSIKVTGAKKTSASAKATLDKTEDKDERFLHITAKAMVNSRNVINGCILIAHDITREKTIERLKNEFISISAHQLRTPLSAVKWTLQMILSGGMGKVKEDVREYINKAYTSNERMITLVNDLLNVSRIEEGRFLYNLEFVSIKNIIKEAVFSSRVLSLKKKVKVIFNPQKNKIPKIKVDFKKMKLAIQNLVDNAINYSIAGNDVVINLKKLKKQANDFILIEVKDNGIGISKKDQKRLFVKFFRGANAIKMQTEGTGLGLFIVKNIIEAHGGKIWYKSDENKGSAFFVRLPVNNN